MRHDYKIRKFDDYFNFCIPNDSRRYIHDDDDKSDDNRNDNINQLLQ